MHGHESSLPCHCVDEACSSGSRNRYFVGKQLTPASFRDEQRYHMERRRLLNRSVHGWGVVHGLAVGLSTAPCEGGQEAVLTIGTGLALDRAGRELFVPQTRRVAMRDIKLLPEPPHEEGRDGQDKGHSLWLLSAHYAERRIDPVVLRDDCHCERSEWNRTCEEVVFSLHAVRPGDAGHAGRCGLNCDCSCTDGMADLRPRDRGPHRCLSDHLTALHLGPQADNLCHLGPDLEGDLMHGVPLATVSLREGAGSCGRVIDAIEDADGPRVLVKRNDLLFDLIRGCDLTVIDEISWGDLHGSIAVPQTEFSRRFSGEEESAGDSCITSFVVRFSRPVREATLRPAAFAMRVIAPDDMSGWGRELRVPITAIEALERTGPDNTLAGGARVVVDGSWFYDEMRSTHRRSIFRNDPVQVEIEVRGDLILDCNGQAVDASAVGARAAPSGNGTPGGTFLSTFTVVPDAR